ncbi:MAG: NAD(P)/FAD-dependent oxidoreductase [Bacteroidaceae bacterium]|nr:NAD(P)/FAD-dependent oxidoreductase [Bacteroidaceae bacterium]
MTDLIIIGAGPGGYKAALHAARLGLQVVLFEDAEVGGTCLNVGCIPTKTFVHAPSFEEAVQRQPLVVAQLRGGVETLLSQPNITLVRERASFVDAHTVASASGQHYTAPNIIVATGSSAKLLPIPGADLPAVVTSTELLQQKELPRRLCIIGAGVIGMEFASVFQRFGAQVTVVEYLKECLPMLDGDIAKRLRKLLEKRGITFHMGAGVQRIAPAAEGSSASVVFEKKGKEEAVEADLILMATGRKPVVSEDFAQAGFDFDERKGIAVDDDFQTTVPGIFAIGDVNGRQMLAHAAEMQGIHVVNRIAGKEDAICFEVMPAAIFTEPEAANVGPSEDQLKAAAIPFECHKAFYRANGKALAMAETEGMVKLCCEPGEGRILSCHVFGAHAADVVQEVTAFITLGASLQQLRDTIHIHPTLSEVLVELN